MLVAYVDESARQRPDDACVYALAAVIVEAADCPGLRDQLKDLRVGKTPTLHWSHESSDRKRLIAETLARMPGRSIVAVWLYPPDTKFERARRRCLDRLLREFHQENVAVVTFESRQEPRDRMDRALLTALRRTGTVPRDLEVSWLRRNADPLLWAADGVAGAVTWWFDGQPEYFRILENKVSLLDVGGP